MNLRFIAAQVINEVTNGSSLSDSLTAALASIKDSRDRGFVQALCYGVCRFYIRLDVLLSQLLTKPMKAKDSDVHALLLIGLYQLSEMRVPAHAAVAETVNATEKLNKPWARGLVNAILRRYLREQEALNTQMLHDEEAQYNHPAWWIKKLKQAWPNEWKTILAANDAHPPFALRVNQQQISTEDYLYLLAKENIPAKKIEYAKQGIILETPRSVDYIPQFDLGAVSVQDGAAQLAATLLELKTGQLVLDACAAPGGKLTHILELVPGITCVAVEKDATRVHTIKENLKRLQLQATCITADAAQVNEWWDGTLFDAILLDAPCSASGVVRRHPDIKLLREASDLKSLVKEQKRLLNALWSILKPSGLLVYATCSIFPDENVDVITDFLKSHADAIEEKINAEWGQACEVGRQILPGMHEMDGFYYARLRKG